MSLFGQDAVDHDRARFIIHLQDKFETGGRMGGIIDQGGELRAQIAGFDRINRPEIRAVQPGIAQGGGEIGGGSGNPFSPGLVGNGNVTGHDDVARMDLPG